MVFYPGSHALGHLETRELPSVPDAGQNPGAQAVTCGVPDRIAPLPLAVRKGSTVFFHSQLVHASNDNRSRGRFRHSFLATYLLKGQPFRPGRAQKRSEVDLHPA
jgi:ectoine hydroxylase-related dioxygenase (phytanoyl-CoA dioxygenase family)